MGEYYAGNTAAADAVLVQTFGSTVVDNTTLLGLYTQTKQYNRAEAIWQLRIKNSPTNVQDYLGLAGVYYQAGDKTNTIATLQKLITIDPADAGQIQQLITQVQSGATHP